MPLKTFVKASGINNLSDARYFSVYPVNWLSYNCDPTSNNYTTVESIKELHGWVEGPKLALEVETLSNDKINELISEVKPQGIQVKSSFKINTELDIFRKVQVHKETSKKDLVEILNDQNLKTTYLLLDFQSISFSSIDEQTNITMEDLQEVNKISPIIINNITNVSEVHSFLKSGLFGLEIAGGEEEKAGIRSFEDIQDIMDELEEWD